MSRAPRLGHRIKRNGKQFVRVLSTTGICNSLPGSCGDYDASDYPRISKAMPQFAAGADYVTDDGRHFGCPIIRSKSHEREMLKRHGFTREYSHQDTEQMDVDRAKQKRELISQFTQKLVTTPLLKGNGFSKDA